MQDEMPQDFSTLIQDATLATRSVRAGSPSNQLNWMSLREEIYRLYIVEGRSLHDVMHIIYQVHNFKAG
jgi:hypothetical protein